MCKQNFHEEERVLDTVFRSRQISSSDPKYEHTLAPYFQLRTPLFYTPLLYPKEVYKYLPSKRPMCYDKGVPWEFKTSFT